MLQFTKITMEAIKQNTIVRDEKFLEKAYL